MKKIIAGLMVAGSTLAMSTAMFTGIAVVGSIAGLQDAEAKRMGGSRSSGSFFSRSSSSTRSTPAPAAKPATPAQPAQSSMIGSNVAPKPAMATSSPMVNRSGMRTSTPPANRTWNSTPAQRERAGSMVQPFLLGVGGAIAGNMLYSWLMDPSTGAAMAATPEQATSADAGGLNIVKPQASFKIYEGNQIPAEFQEKMKANNVTVEPKQGEVTEYSKTIKVKGDLDVRVNVAELPVLVVYEDVTGKPKYDLFMPI